MQKDFPSSQTTNPADADADATANAYARWVIAHHALTEAEQQLSLLSEDAGSDVKAAARERVEGLREQSEKLLQAAQAELRARGS